ncbi:2-phosphosulfolactate phosphatase [Kovacikia minuta CCNUW1]|uniref:2-phosphosulfolactate phosphatase n=1 Tax=Kovacikia minuta TaxID=2931930 RepID=UPI001CCDE2B1|nr:2-phosphosulfolactate phosphatase [Kovacikia minuta]UBF26493.1 2-phosphosulfolactate phosphatase [Kovacikia minuta CCNUW1]
MMFDQTEFDLRCEWGEQGVINLAPTSDAIVIVDVLSFSTCVEIATSRGAVIFPYRFQDGSALTYAQSVNALLATHQRGAGYSLSPSSLIQIPAGTRLVIPSPNGSTLTLLSGQTPTIAGCLRNGEAVARFAQTLGNRIAVIPAGERWREGSLRPAWEDWVGAGAILSHLQGSRSPEAEAAIVAFQHAKENLQTRLSQCGSGKELIARGIRSRRETCGNAQQQPMRSRFAQRHLRCIRKRLNVSSHNQMKIAANFGNIPIPPSNL